jgi:hypothetical protein
VGKSDLTGGEIRQRNTNSKEDTMSRSKSSPIRNTNDFFNRLYSLPKNQQIKVAIAVANALLGSFPKSPKPATEIHGLRKLASQVESERATALRRKFLQRQLAELRISSLQAPSEFQLDIKNRIDKINQDLSDIK